MKAYPLLVLQLCVLFIGPGQAYSGGQDTVATVGNNAAITFRELQEYVRDRFYDRMYHTSPAGYAYQMALEDMLVDQLKRIDFFERGLEKDTTLLQNNRRMINEEVIIKYFENEFIGKRVNDASIRDAYEQMKREVVCRRFVVDSSAIGPAQTRTALNTVAGKLEAERARGTAFDDLVSDCRRWLNAPKARDKTESVTWKKSLTNTADSVIFDLPVGDVRILMFPTELQIVKITKINRLTVEPFEKVKDDIYKTLRQEKMEASYDEFNRIKTGLLNESGLQWNKKGLDQLLVWSNIRGFYGRIYADTLAKAIAEGRNVVLLKYRNGSVDLKEYLRLLNDVLTLSERGQFKLADLKAFILEALRSDKLVKKAVAQGYAKDILKARTSDPVMKARLVSFYNQREIEGKIPKLTEEAIRKFYAANRDSLYYQLAKVNIYAIISSDKKKIDSLWQKHVLGTPFEKLSRNWFVKGFIKDRYDDTVRSYRSPEKPFLGSAAIGMTLNQVAGPILYHDPDQGGQYAIIKCVERRPEKQLTLDEARNTIADDFKEYQKRKIERETAARLKRTYSYKIYEDVLQREIAAVIKK